LRHTLCGDIGDNHHLAVTITAHTHTPYSTLVTVVHNHPFTMNDVNDETLVQLCPHTPKLRLKYARPVVLVVGLILCIMTSGTLYGYGLFAPQLRDTLGFTQTQSNLIGACGAVGQYMGFLSGMFNDSYGHRLCCALGGVALFCGYLSIWLASTGLVPLPWWSLCIAMWIVGQVSNSLKNDCACDNSLVRAHSQPTRHLTPIRLGISLLAVVPWSCPYTWHPLQCRRCFTRPFTPFCL
jgi:hypothetical protein